MQKIYPTRHTTKKRSLLAVTSLLLMPLLIANLWLLAAQAAGTASLSLSPSSGSYQLNTSYTVSIYENSGSEPVNAVQANLTYDASKLQFVSVSNSGSPFSTCPQAPAGGGGNVTISCALLGSTTTGNQLVGSVTFSTLAGSGTTAINFRTDSKIVRSSDNTDVWNGNTTGGSFNLTTPASPPPPPPPSPTPTPTPTPNPTPNSHSPAPTPNKPSTSPDPSPTPIAAVPGSAAQQANPNAPVPVSSHPTSLTSYLIAIKTLDESGKIIIGATVTLDKQTATSDVSGVASFTSVPPGKHQVKIKSKHGTVLSSIDVTTSKSPTVVQSFNVKLAAKTSSISFIVIIPTILILLTVAAVIVYRSGGISGLRVLFNKEPIVPADRPLTPEKLGLDILPNPNVPNPSSVIEPTQTHAGTLPDHKVKT